MEYTQSRVGIELQYRYEEKELVRMWNQFWTSAKVIAVLGVIYATHTMNIFLIVVAMAILYTAYKINWK